MNKDFKILILIPFYFVIINLHPAGISAAGPVWETPVNCEELNTKEDDFAPAWDPYENQLYFNSIRSGYSYYFKTEFSDSLEFEEPVKLKGAINRKNNNQSYFTFLNSEEALISTFRLTPARSYLNIFKAVKEKQAWSEPFVLDSLKCDCFTSHPTVSPSGNVMIFSTNRGGKYSDTDLWIARRLENDAWGALTPLNEINSLGNEITPFLISDDSLLFATDGQEGPGGYDIFISEYSEGLWQRPTLMENINTEFNESDPAFLPGNRLIFSSDRPGGMGKLDLYITQRSILHEKQKEQIDIHISLEALVTSIEIVKNFKYEIYPLISCIFFDKEYNFPPLRAIDQETAISKINRSIDSLYSFSPAVLASRLRNANAELIITTKDTDNSDIKNSSFNIDVNGLFFPKNSSDILKFFKEKLNYKNVELKEDQDFMNNSADYARLVTSSEEAFSSIEAGKMQFEITPSLIELELKARPADKIRNYRLYLVTDGEKNRISVDGGEVPAKFRIDPKPFAGKIWDADSVSIQAELTDVNGNKHFKNRTFSLIHNEVSEIKNIRSGSKIYNQYFIFAPNIRLITEHPGNKGIIDHIAENSFVADRIIIQYFNDTNNLSRNLAEKVRNDLGKAVQKNSPDIITEYNTGSEFFSCSNSLKPYLIRILVQKRAAD